MKRPLLLIYADDASVSKTYLMVAVVAVVVPFTKLTRVLNSNTHTYINIM